MSDNSTRWQRVVSQSDEKPRFQARQTTGDMPRHRRTRISGTRSHRVERAKRLYILGVFVLLSLAAVLAWLIFFA
jgi:hypothetical protein